MGYNIKQTVSVLTSVEDIANEPKVKVYPNPFTGFVHVEFENGAAYGGLDELWVTGALGQVVYRQRLSGGLVDIDGRSWSEGIYFLFARIGGKRVCFGKVGKVD